MVSPYVQRMSESTRTEEEARAEREKIARFVKSADQTYAEARGTGKAEKAE